MDFSVSSINFMISMRSLSFTKIIIRLSKWFKTEDGARAFFHEAICRLDVSYTPALPIMLT